MAQAKQPVRGDVGNVGQQEGKPMFDLDLVVKNCPPAVLCALTLILVETCVQQTIAVRIAFGQIHLAICTTWMHLWCPRLIVSQSQTLYRRIIYVITRSRGMCVIRGVQPCPSGVCRLMRKFSALRALAAFLFIFHYPPATCQRKQSISTPFLC